MSSPPPPVTDSITISRRKVERDLKVSLVLLVAGLVLTGVWMVLEFTHQIVVQNSSDMTTFVIIDAIGGTADVFILVGAIFAAINWSLLRKQRQST